MNKFKFLTSTRFWAMTLGAILLFFHQEGMISESLFVAISTFLAGFTGIRTVDRISEKLGEKKEAN